MLHAIRSEIYQFTCAGMVREARQLRIKTCYIQGRCLPKLKGNYGFLNTVPWIARSDLNCRLQCESELKAGYNHLPESRYQMCPRKARPPIGAYVQIIGSRDVRTLVKVPKRRKRSVRQRDHVPIPDIPDPSSPDDTELRDRLPVVACETMDTVWESVCLADVAPPDSKCHESQ